MNVKLSFESKFETNTHAANLCLVCRVAWNVANVRWAVCKLTLDTISTALLFLPVPANLGFVQPNLPVMGARTTHNEALSLIDQMREPHLRLRVGVDLPGGRDRRLGWVIHVRTGSGRRHGDRWGTSVKVRRCCLREELRPHERRCNANIDAKSPRRERVHRWE